MGQLTGRKELKDRRSKIIFLFSVAFLAYFTGMLTGAFQLPPYRLVSSSVREVIDFGVHWQNDLGIEPTRHLMSGQGSRRGWNIVDSGRMSKGLRLIAGLTPNHEALYGVRLYDQEGNELHYWPVHYDRLDPDGRSPNNIILNGFSVFEDGSLAINFNLGGTLAKLDACGDTIWKLDGGFHHVVNRSFDGSIWAWKVYSLAQIDPADGAIMREIRLFEDVILANDQMGIFGILKSDEPNPTQFRFDPFHPNDVEILGPDIAGAFDQFEAGDILISLRTPNLVAVIDADTFKVKWWQHGPWHRQHDPDFQPDGTITVFDNRLDLGQSQLIRIDPDTHHWSVVFRGSDEMPFYTRIAGQHQILENGNLLLTASRSGRVLELSPDGELLWEFANLFDETRNGLVSMTMVVPDDFFLPDALNCPARASSSRLMSLDGSDPAAGRKLSKRARQSPKARRLAAR